MPDTMSGPGTNFLGPVRAIVGEYDGVIAISPFDLMADGALTIVRTAAGDYGVRLTAAAGTFHLAAVINDSMLNKFGTDPITYGSNAGLAVGVNTPVPPSPASGTPARSGQFLSPDPYPFGIGHNVRGFQIVEVDLDYTVGTANLTTFSFNMYRRKHVDNAAGPTILADPGAPYSVNAGAYANAPGVLPVVSRVNRYYSSIVFQKAYTLGNNDVSTGDVIELTAVNPGTSVLTLYGILFKVNYNLF